jgi:hypothetical protein
VDNLVDMECYSKDDQDDEETYYTSHKSNLSNNNNRINKIEELLLKLTTKVNELVNIQIAEKSPLYKKNKTNSVEPVITSASISVLPVSNPQTQQQ